MLLKTSAPSTNIVEHTTFVPQQGYLIPLPSLHSGKGYSFPGLIALSDMVNSTFMMGIKPGDSSMVTGYYID